MAKRRSAHLAQVAALPVREGPNGLEVLLITSRETKGWIVPKGWPMKGRQDHLAAAREAFEEAGVAGDIVEHPICAFTYDKQLGKRTVSCRVMVYLLNVDREFDSWMERDQRDRQWFMLADAAKKVGEKKLAEIIRTRLL